MNRGNTQSKLGKEEKNTWPNARLHLDRDDPFISIRRTRSTEHMKFAASLHRNTARLHRV
jgi:hypothetical protein